MNKNDALEEQNNDLDLIKFLVERAHGEARLFYVRNAVFLGLHALAFREVFQTINSTSCINSIVPALTWICIGGVIVGISWVAVNMRSMYYNWVWLKDARKIAESNEYLSSRLQNSLGIPGMQKYNIFKVWKWPAVYWFQLLAVLSIIGWLLLMISYL